jgi:hypothetical protein
MNKIFIGMSTVLAMAGSIFLEASACEQYWISGISDCGQLVQLNSNQAWQVHDIDRHQVLKWRLGEHVVVCQKKSQMKNVDKKIEAQRWIKVKQASYGKRLKSNDSCEFKPNEPQEE